MVCHLGYFILFGMAKRSFDSKFDSNNLLKYFNKAPKENSIFQIKHPSKKNKPNNFYDNCLNDQYLQIDGKDASEDEN